jgi:MSHA biogenesis protein MshJ
VQVEGSQFYRHGVEISLTGGYFDLMQYLAELEKLPARLLWGSGTLQSEQYPEVRLTLQVYTLAPQPSLGL